MNWITVEWASISLLLSPPSISERLYKWFSDLTGVKLKFNSAIYIIIVIHPSIHIDDTTRRRDDAAHVIKATLIMQPG